nr:hypothetical protein [Planctomycetota bacterium]
LLDSHLPMVTGIELVTFIRRSDAFDHTPVFIFASPKDYADVTAAVDIAPDSFLKKPVEWDHFRLLADTLMRGAWRSVEAPTKLPEADVAPDPVLKQRI